MKSFANFNKLFLSLLMDGTGLPRHQIMDHIFEGNMLDEINQLFLPNMRNKLLWFYQEVEEVEQTPDYSRPGPSRATASSSRTPVAGSSAMNASKNRLFLTDGWTCSFTGVCIYMFRINISKQLPEEGFHKDLWVEKCFSLSTSSQMIENDEKHHLHNIIALWIFLIWKFYGVEN